jgi:hypothetical protein
LCRLSWWRHRCAILHWPLRRGRRLGGDEGVLPAVVVADGKVLPIPLLPVALQPALWDRAYEGALAGMVEMVWGSMLEAAGRVRVGWESAHGVVVGEWICLLGVRARMLQYWLITCCHRKFLAGKGV